MLIYNVTGTVSNDYYGISDVLVRDEGFNWRNCTHNEHIYGEGMWLATGTAPHWAEFNFDKVYNVGHIYVWNHNQPNLLDRGLKNVYITYTSDGITWLESDPSMFTLTQGTGLNGLSYDILDLGGVNASSVRITAALEEGNYGSDFYGLSKVLFGQHGTTFETIIRSEDPIVVKDIYGRELNDYQVTLVDWQGYLYNPMIEVKLTPPQTGVSYPLTFSWIITELSPKERSLIFLT